MVTESRPAETVLLATSEASLGEPLAAQLRECGYHTNTVRTAKDTVDRSRAARLVVLETQLQGESGLEVLRRLREDPATASVPVIMLGGNDSVDKVSAFELGADDFVVTPPSSREFVLRVRAVLRRSRHDEAVVVSGDVETIGPITLDAARHEVRVHGDTLHLTALEFRLLQYLATHVNQACRRQQLLHEVWGTGGGAVDRAVDTTIKRLRKKLSAAGSMVETVRGVGYRLSDAVSPPPG